MRSAVLTMLATPLRSILLASVLALFCQLTTAESDYNDRGLILVMNCGGEEKSFSKQQIRHIFMGGALSRKYKAINLPAGHPLRVQFNTRIIGLTESRIQSYWAQMKFTGRSQPPEEAANIEMLLEILSTTQDTIGYLPAGMNLPTHLAIVYPHSL